MWTQYNPNPSGKSTIDCTVRALCKALDLTWDQVFMLEAAVAFEMKTMPSSSDVWGRILRDHGFHRHALPDTCPDCYTVSDFCKDHPQGRFVLATGDHVCTVIDGRLYDAWNSLDEAPQFYWEE